MIQRTGTFVRRKYQPLLLSSFFAYLFCIVSEFIDTTIGTNLLPNPLGVGDAIEVVSPIYQIIVFVGGLISIGCATLYQQYLGKYENKKAYKLFGQSIILSLTVGVIMSLIMVFCKKPFLKFFGCTDDVLELAMEYYNFYIFIAFLYPQYWLLYYMVHNDADEKICFISDGLQLGVNLLVSILVVKFTDFGIAGLSLGTLCGLIVATLLLFIHFLKKNNSIKVAFGFNTKDAIESIKLGASTSFTYLFVAIVDIVMNKYIQSSYGKGYLTAYSVCNLLLNLATVYLNLGESANPFNCVYYSEKNNHGIRKVMKIGHFYSLIEGLFFTIIFISFAGLFPKIFNITDPVIYEESKFICRIISITMVPTAFLFLYISYYPSIKKELYSFILSIMYMLVFPLALAIPLAHAIGFKGISIGLMLVPIASFLVLFIILVVTKNFKKFPLLLDKDEYKTMSFDIKVSRENAIEISNKSIEFLVNNGLDKSKEKIIKDFIIEIYDNIIINNENNKTDSKFSKQVLSEIDLMINENKVIISTRDNGTIFDMSKLDDNHYKINDKFKEDLKLTSDHSYLTTTSFNRNTFEFNLK